MAVNDRVYKYSRATFGNTRSLDETRNIVSVSYAYTNYKKRPAGASTTAVMAATAVAAAGQTFTTGITNPDVPRALSVTVAASTGAHIAAGSIVVTGKNVEGKTITESFAVSDDTAATITGVLAFKEVTSVAVPAQDGASVTVAVGTRDILGLNHRVPSGATYRVVTQTTGGTRAIQSAPSASTQSTTLVEANTITPATAPDGTKTFTAHVLFSNWHLDPTNAQPSYGA